MSRPPRIADFVIDDENADKAWKHGILPGQLLQVLDNRPGIVVNRRNRRGLYKRVETTVVPVSPSQSSRPVIPKYGDPSLPGTVRSGRKRCYDESERRNERGRAEGSRRLG